MRKIYAIMICLLAGMSSVFAQKDNSIVFADANGNEYADGAVIDATTAEESPAGMEISSGLYLKNTSAAVARAEISYVVSSLDNGYHQLCTQIQCTTDNSTGSNTYPIILGIRPGQSLDLLAEWFASDYGQATVTYTLTLYSYANETYTKIGDGYSITVNYIYADPAGINGVNADAVSTTYYDLKGNKVENPAKGMYITKKLMQDGSLKTAKVIMK